MKLNRIFIGIFCLLLIIMMPLHSPAGAEIVGNGLSVQAASGESFALAITAAGTGAGTVTCGGSACAASYSGKVMLKATPAISSTFKGWSGGACSGKKATCAVTMKAAKTVTAEFTIKSFAVAASAGKGGSISPSAKTTVSYGASQTFTITPTAGYDISNVTDNGKSVTSEVAGNKYTLTNIIANHAIKASFKKAAGGGSCTITTGSATICSDYNGPDWQGSGNIVSKYCKSDPYTTETYSPSGCIAAGYIGKCSSGGAFNVDSYYNNSYTESEMSSECSSYGWIWTSLSGSGQGDTAQKRTVILFPNPSSPVSFVDYASDGIGIVGYRSASGLVSTLGVVERDGTYYQLASANSGLSGIKTGGYQVTVLSTNADNSVKQIAVTGPSGVAAQYPGIVSPAPRSAPSLDDRTVSEICDNPDGTHGLEDSNFPRTYACYISYSFGHPTFNVLRSVWAFCSQYATEIGSIATGVFDKLKASKSYEKVEDEMDQVPAKLNGSPDAIKDMVVSNQIVTPSGTDESFAKRLVNDVKKIGINQNEKTLDVIDPLKVQTLSGEIVNPPSVTCTPPAVMQNGVCVTPPAAKALPAPTNLTATLSTTVNGAFTLMWDAVPGADRYFIYMHKTTPPRVDIKKFGQDTTISPVTTNYFYGQNLLVGTYYFVVVAAHNNTAAPLKPQMGKPSAAVSLKVSAPPVIKTGKISVWTNNSSGVSAVYIDGGYVGGLSTYYPSGSPKCGDSGTITKTLPVGTHTIEATGNNVSWGPTTVNITAGKCVPFKLEGSNTGGGGGGGGGDGGGSCYEPNLIGTWYCSTGDGDTLTITFTSGGNMTGQYYGIMPGAQIGSCSASSSYKACGGVITYTNPTSCGGPKNQYVLNSSGLSLPGVGWGNFYCD